MGTEETFTEDGRRATAIAFALVLVTIAALLVATIGPSPAAARKAPFIAKLSAPGHKPKAGKKWPVRVTARSRSGKALSGRISYEFYFKGERVSTQSNYAFRNGRFTDRTFVWPKRAVGIPLTLKVVVKTSLGTVRLPYSVVVRK